jgi:hypothetical protein
MVFRLRKPYSRVKAIHINPHIIVGFNLLRDPLQIN